MWKHSSRTHRLVIVLEVMGGQYGIKGTISCKIAFLELLTVITVYYYDLSKNWLKFLFDLSVVSLSNPAYLLVSFPHSKYNAFSDTHHRRNTLEIFLHLKKYCNKGVWSSCKILNKAWYSAFNNLCTKCWYFLIPFFIPVIVQIWNTLCTIHNTFL